MKNLKILISAILVLILVSSLCLAQEEIMPLSQVKRGMWGYGKSVFEGTEPETFDVKIIGIWEYFGMELIVAKISGGPNNIINKARVIAGMSGSPIYLWDLKDKRPKKIGALAYSFINQREAICLITPIEKMLEAGQDKSNRQNTIEAKSSNTVSSIAIPISSYGFSQRALEMTKSFSKERGLNLEFITGKGGGAKTTKPDQSNSLKAGDAIAVELMGGDFGLRGVGTVTHIEKNKVYAFGHPFFGKGENIDLPFYKAKILTVISAVPSFKLTESIFEPSLGSIKKDMNTAIVGTLGAEAKVIPVSINLKHNNYKKGFNIQLSQNFFATDILALIAITNAITLEKADISEATIKLGMKIKLKNIQNKLETSTLTTTDKWGLNNSSLVDFYGLLYCGFKPFLEAPLEANLEKIEFTIEIVDRKVFEIRNAFLKINGKGAKEKETLKKDLRIIETNLKPGNTVELNILIKEIYSGQYYSGKLSFKIKKGTPNGSALLIIINGKWLAWILSIPEISMGIDFRAISDLNNLLAAVKYNSERDPDKFYAILIVPAKKKKKTKKDTDKNWQPITSNEIGGNFSTHLVVIKGISPNLKGETQGFVQFILKIKKKKISLFGF